MFWGNWWWPRLLVGGGLLVGSAATANETIAYTYDAQGRLIAVDRTGGVNNGQSADIEYDGAGNRIHLSVTGVSGSIRSFALGNGGRQDFNGDGRGDILWRHDDGTFTTWWLDGPQVWPNTSWNNQIDTSWISRGAFDFDGDADSDLLWQKDFGDHVEFSISRSDAGTFVLDAVHTSFDAGWGIIATLDHDGSGRDDLLFRHANGQFSIWQSLSAGGFAQNSYYDHSVSIDWTLIGTGDFSGDGKDDLLWRHSNGEMTVWHSTGSGFIVNAYWTNSVSTAWQVVGVGDFNGDGKTDLLWRHSEGAITEWQSTGSGFIANVYGNAGIPLDWKVARIDDFNGDGLADILFRNFVTGAFSTWQSIGNAFDPNIVYNTTVSTAWVVQAAT